MGLIAETIAKPCTHRLHTDSYSPAHGVSWNLLILEEIHFSPEKVISECHTYQPDTTTLEHSQRI